MSSVEAHRWDLDAEDPEQYPAGGQPEDYILRREHREDVADQMEDLWEADVDHVSADVREVGWRDFVRKFDSPFAGITFQNEPATGSSIAHPAGCHAAARDTSTTGDVLASL